jgi:hypothetical protein
MKQAIVSIVIVCLITACAGRNPRPVDTMKVTDKEMTCEQIQNELLLANNEISRLSVDADKTAKNVALGVAGWFLIIPWFFMDLKNAEKAEMEAYRQRLNNLNLLYMNKRCA